MRRSVQLIHLPGTHHHSYTLHMNIFGRLFGEKKRFMSAAEAQKNLANQVAMTPQTMAALRKHGVAESSRLKLEYFFYTDTPSKGADLCATLLAKGYTSACKTAAGNPGLQVVTGWTDPLAMTDEIVLQWTEAMCVLGHVHDCEFDGWGTNPQQ